MFGAGFPQLLLSTLKGYYRNRQAIFFSFVFPLVIMGLFGLFNFGDVSVELGIVDESRTPATSQLVSNLHAIKALHVHQGSRAEEEAALKNGYRDAVAVLP